MPFIVLAAALTGIACLLLYLALSTGRGFSPGGQRLISGDSAASDTRVGILPQERLAELRRQAEQWVNKLGRNKKVPSNLGQRLKWSGIQMSPGAWQMLPYPLAGLGAVVGVGIGEFVPPYLPVTVLGCAFAAGMVPAFLLSARLSRRRMRIASEILTYSEYLAMAMQAGADFRTAVGQVEERFPGPVAEAFSTAVLTSAVGGQMDDGLRAAQAVLNNPDADAIIGTLIKQQQYGAQSAEELLKSVAGVRRNRVEKVLEKASRAALMLLLPIAVFIIPVFFGLILWPMLSQAMGVLHG